MFVKSLQEESATFIFKSANENICLGKERLSWVLTEAAETTENYYQCHLLTVPLFIHFMCPTDIVGL
jgi:hypothetical protein